MTRPYTSETEHGTCVGKRQRWFQTYLLEKVEDPLHRCPSPKLGWFHVRAFELRAKLLQRTSSSAALLDEECHPPRRSKTCRFTPEGPTYPRPRPGSVAGDGRSRDVAPEKDREGWCFSLGTELGHGRSTENWLDHGKL